MKKILLILLTFFSLSVIAQVKTNQPVLANSIPISSAALDLSSSPTWNATTNQGKGILFSRTDLTTFTTFSHGGSYNSANNPNRFDALLVFNVASGVAAIGRDSVKVGYYYYRNTTNYADSGHWVAVSSGGSDSDVGGSGTSGKLSMWKTSSSIANSIISIDTVNSRMGINTVTPEGVIDAWGNTQEDNIPLMSALNAPSPLVSSASTTTSGYEAYKAFNKAKLQYGWISASGQTTGWLKLDLGVSTPKTITAYSITAPQATYILSTPKSWTFEGSNNDTAWATLDTKTNITTWGYNDTKVFAISNSTPYRYYRLNVSANNGNATYLIISQLRLLELALRRRFYSDTLGAFNINAYNGQWGKIVSFKNGSGIEVAGIDYYGYMNSGQLTVGGSIFSTGTLYVNTSAIIGSLNPPLASSVMEFVSTTKGILPPRMTTTQKAAISAPAEGLMVYDLTLHKLYVWDGSTWQACY